MRCWIPAPGVHRGSRRTCCAPRPGSPSLGTTGQGGDPRCRPTAARERGQRASPTPAAQPQSWRGPPLTAMLLALSLHSQRHWERAFPLRNYRNKKTFVPNANATVALIKELHILQLEHQQRNVFSVLHEEQHCLRAEERAFCRWHGNQMCSPYFAQQASQVCQSVTSTHTKTDLVGR